MDELTSLTGDVSQRALSELAAHFSIEATPRTVLTKPAHLAGLPKGTQVYVPFLPGARFEETIRVCRALEAAGFAPVPHLAARAVPSREALEAWVRGLASEGVDALLLIAGDLDAPKGPYSDVASVLETGLLADNGIRRIGIAGHPEGHVRASPAALEKALAAKTAYARETGSEMWIVTQFAFSAEPVIDWLARLEASGCDLPVRVGVPGPATLPTLTAYALRCGIGASVKALRQRPETARRLLGRWTPDDLVQALAAHRAQHPKSQLSGLHIFPFGGIPAATAWLDELRMDAVRWADDAPAVEAVRCDHGGAP